MDNIKIEEVHKYLTNIYDNAELIFEKVKNKYTDVSLSSFTNHYIMINNKLEHQKYFMPVITVNKIGDICFNLDGIGFEFILEKEQISDIDLNCLIQNFTINIYGQENCLNDFYLKGDNSNEIVDKILKSDEKLIGISIDCDFDDFDLIFDNFYTISEIIRK